jgi:hypothetical protein
MDGQALENNAGGLGLFGDDDEEENEHQQIQQQQYEDDLDADDILGLDDDAGAIENPEGSLLMRFCPHDSSMLYPKVRLYFGGTLHTCFSSHVTTNTHITPPKRLLPHTYLYHHRKIVPSANFFTHVASAAIRN